MISFRFAIQVVISAGRAWCAGKPGLLSSWELPVFGKVIWPRYRGQIVDQSIDPGFVHRSGESEGLAINVESDPIFRYY